MPSASFSNDENDGVARLYFSPSPPPKICVLPPRSTAVVARTTFGAAARTASMSAMSSPGRRALLA